MMIEVFCDQTLPRLYIRCFPSRLDCKILLVDSQALVARVLTEFEERFPNSRSNAATGAVELRRGAFSIALEVVGLEGTVYSR